MLISSRGLLKSCGVHNRQPVSSSAAIDADLLARHRACGSIYVCTDALAAFVSTHLPQIQTPFTLVSGDSDTPVSPESLGDQVFRTLLEHSLCQGWFAQNVAARHPRLHALPIGLD